jgi:hypothetical protein
MGTAQNKDYLFKNGRPRWADELWPTLPCQQPDVQPDWWHDTGTGSEGRENRAKAMLLCVGCPQRDPCREAGRGQSGIWGGVLYGQLNRAGQRSRKGAPA